MVQRISNAVQAAITHAADEAARRGDRRIGTDHLLLGLLHDPEIAAELGTDLDRARTSAVRLDHAALAAIGLELGALRLPEAAPAAGHAPPSSGMRATMARALTIARADHVRTVEPRHLLRALLELSHPDPAATLLAALRR
jgi:ATP-dependent Clp protease ATP-binding subunit ClpA